MTIVRFSPGAIAPRDAQYARVGHYGEYAGFAVWRVAGKALPLLDPEDELVRPVWFVELVAPLEERVAA